MTRNTTPYSNASSADLVQAIARRLKNARESQRLSASELARRAGLAKSTLTQLEAGKGNPGVETLWALANALDMPFAQLIDVPPPAVHVVRAGDGLTTFAERTDFAATLLATCPPGPTHNVYRIALAAGAERHSKAHRPGTSEYLFVTRGAMRAGPATDPVTLSAGDYLTFPADGDHVYAAADEPAAALLIMEYVG